jgi:hypothetical protein
MTLPIYELIISENLDDDSQVSAIALVDEPATKRLFSIFKEEFINPSKGENEKDFIERCIKYVINEGKDSEQAVAICNSMWKEHFAEESYTDYPKEASENAKIALRWAEDNGWGECGTPVGKIRANQLAKIFALINPIVEAFKDLGPLVLKFITPIVDTGTSILTPISNTASNV